MIKSDVTEEVASSPQARMEKPNKMSQRWLLRNHPPNEGKTIQMSLMFMLWYWLLNKQAYLQSHLSNVYPDILVVKVSLASYKQPYAKKSKNMDWDIEEIDQRLAIDKYRTQEECNWTLMAINIKHAEKTWSF